MRYYGLRNKVTGEWFHGSHNGTVPRLYTKRMLYAAPQEWDSASRSYVVTDNWENVEFEVTGTLPDGRVIS